MGILAKTRVYLIGPMEFDSNGKDWRDTVIERLSVRGITIFSPYSHPFINGYDEGEKTRELLSKLREEERFDELSAHVKLIRSDDLRVCDISDFFIAFLDLDKYTTGSMEEIFWANRLKKPIFLVFKQGKKRAPLWFFGTIPHKYFYNDLESALRVIENIDDGIKKIDSTRWRILQEQYR